jgi:hypothetical protein
MIDAQADEFLDMKSLSGQSVGGAGLRPGQLVVIADGLLSAERRQQSNPAQVQFACGTSCLDVRTSLESGSETDRTLTARSTVCALAVLSGRDEVRRGA